MFAFIFAPSFVAAFVFGLAFAQRGLTPVRACGAGMPISRRAPSS